MMLFVDDIRTPASMDWTVAREIGSAIRFLHRYGTETDFISLDHDISHQVSVGSHSRPFRCDDCFCAVAYYMVAYYKGRKKKPMVYIHTANPTGADKLVAILRPHRFKIEVNEQPPVNRLETEV